MKKSTFLALAALMAVSVNVSASQWMKQSQEKAEPTEAPIPFDQSTATEEMRGCLKSLAYSLILSNYPKDWVSNVMYQISDVQHYPNAGIMVVNGWVKYDVQGGEEIVSPVAGNC